MTKFVKLYRDAGAASTGGELPPSIADLSNPDTDPVEGLDAEGNVLDGYEKLEDGTVRKIESTEGNNGGDEGEGGEEEEEDDDISPEDFFKEVEAKTNYAVQVDYQGVDPLSPEGVALREVAIVQQAELSYDEHIRRTMPRAYAYMLHVKNGGSDEEFFAVKTTPLADKETFSNDLDAQRSFVVSDLISKGVPDEIAKLTADKYIKDNTLTTKALELYEVKKQEEDKLLQDQIKKDAQRKTQFQQEVQSLTASIQKGIENEIKLVVPADKKKEFYNFVIENLEHDGENFYLAQKLDPTKLDAGMLEALYLQFVKGDVSALIKREGKKQTLQRLGQRVKTDKATKTSSGDAGKQTNYIPLSKI